MHVCFVAPGMNGDVGERGEEASSTNGQDDQLKPLNLVSPSPDLVLSCVTTGPAEVSSLNALHDAENFIDLKKVFLWLIEGQDEDKCNA